MENKTKWKGIKNVPQSKCAARLVKSLPLAWFGHVESMAKDRIPETFLHGKMEGRGDM